MTHFFSLENCNFLDGLSRRKRRRKVHRRLRKSGIKSWGFELRARWHWKRAMPWGKGLGDDVRWNDKGRKHRRWKNRRRKEGCLYSIKLGHGKTQIQTSAHDVRVSVLKSTESFFRFNISFPDPVFFFHFQIFLSYSLPFLWAMPFNEIHSFFC